MKEVFIIGTGLNPQLLAGTSLDLITKADLIIGAPRLVESFSHLGKALYPIYEAKAVAKLIGESPKKLFAVLVSGDVGFFSAATGIKEALAEVAKTTSIPDKENPFDFTLEFIPGTSSLVGFMAKLKLPWQDVAVLSLHGIKGDVVSTVRRNKKTFCLTGNNLADIGQALVNSGLGRVTIFVGSNLDYPQESIQQLTASELATINATANNSLSVLLVTNQQADPRCRYGIDDQEFCRGEAPMTKAEVRAVSLSKLALKPRDICYDIGAGTGSVTIEMALAAYEGHVFAIEQRGEALALIQENCRHFHVGNVTPILGQAPTALEVLVKDQGIPAPDAVFIGGSGGELRGVLEYVIKLNPDVRLVLNAIVIESLSQALKVLAELGHSDIEVSQVSIAKSKQIKGQHLMLAHNPVYIIKAQRPILTEEADSID